MQSKFLSPVLLAGIAAFAAGSVQAQSNSVAVPPPSQLISSPFTPPPPPAPAPMVNPADLSAEIVTWDATDKAVTVNFGEPLAKYEFSLTNVSDAAVTVVAVSSSCGCTTAKVPPMPWVIESGKSGQFAVNMNLAGKNGTVIKTVTVATDKGTKHLLVRTTILPLPTAAQMAPGSREVNQRLALADRQAVFKGDCATCHADVAKNKTGKELYVAVCGVCHEAEHRASMVPDLRIAKQERNEEYWRNWVSNGKQGSLMPAFALPAGGILSDEQITSLVEYLSKNMSSKPTPGVSAAVAH